MTEVNAQRDAAEQRIQSMAGQVAAEEGNLAEMRWRGCAQRQTWARKERPQLGKRDRDLKEKLIGQRMELERQQARFHGADLAVKAVCALA